MTAKTTIEDMRVLAAELGGRCLSADYQGSMGRLHWQCRQGHEWEAAPAHVREGAWCPRCAGRIQTTIEDMQSLAARKGGECLDDVWQNSQTKILWQCGQGHQWKAAGAYVKQGAWCPVCAGGNA